MYKRQLLGLGLGLVAAGAIGALSASRPTWALALVCGFLLAILIAVRINFLLLLLVFTMFVESVSLGSGLRIGRDAGALAAVVVVYILLSRRQDGLRSNALLVTAGCYGAWMLISTYWATSSGEVFRLLFSYALAVAYMFAFALLVRSGNDLRGILATLTFLSLIHI